VGVKVNYSHVSSESLALYNNSRFSACVHDIHLNKTDLCVGPFTETFSRRNLTTFVSPLDTNNYQLLVKTKKVNISFFKLFEPFTFKVWICFGCFVLITGILYYFSET